MEDKSFLSQVKGFTPVIDILAEELGAMTALVYGIVWRYCQMEDKVCRASKETIAHHANLSTKTVQRHLQTLVAKGYLEDTTPDRKHKPHVYKDAGKVQINGLVEAKLTGRSESPTSEEGGSESPTRGDTESQLGRTESPVKRVLDDTLEDRKESPADFGIGETDPLDGVPQATDGHQRAVDGGNGADPVTEVARHLRWLCDGRSMEFPKTQKGQAPYMKAAQDLIARTDAIDDWQILCAAIDDWSENPPEDDKWWRQKSKKPSYPVDHLVTHYGQYKENGSAPPALATPGPLPDFVTS